jgi:hypothetical protein
MIRRLSFSLSVVFFGLLVSGTKACQEDYFIALAKVAATATPNGTNDTITETPTGSVTITTTVTDVPTETPIPTETISGTVIPTATIAGTPTAITATLKSKTGISKADLNELNNSSNSAAAPKKIGNYLGRAFNGGKQQKNTDSDGDGFTDEFEKSKGSDPNDPSSVPNIPQGNYSRSLLGVDDDFDGVSNKDEQLLGTNSNIADTDGDGCSDGTEIALGTDPLTANTPVADSDGDCLPDAYEKSHGLDPNNRDTDGDGIDDGIEIGLGLNPNNPDTNGDGIFDGKELDLDIDPKK